MTSDSFKGGRRGHRVCPQCGSDKIGRSHRRTAADRLRSLSGVYPYRCNSCEARFYDGRSSRWIAERRDPGARWARCPNCGSTEINRIARDKVPATWGNLFWRLIALGRARGFRCPGCRTRFLTMRPRKVSEAQLAESGGNLDRANSIGHGE